MKMALVHDWLTLYGGAERCVESFTNIWDDLNVYSLIDFLSDEDRTIILKGKKAETSFISKLPMAKTKYRNYLPLFPLAIEQFDMTGYDMVLSSSHAVAKGVITRPDQLHICYIYSPVRYAWDLYFQYLRESGLNKGLKGTIAKYFLHRLRIWDVTTANRPDHYVAISKYIAGRVKKTYAHDADVIYPPVDTDNFTLGDGAGDYYITFSRMVPYKKIDLIAESFTLSGKKLIIIGDGPEMDKVKSKSGRNVEILGHQPKNTIIELTKHAKAFIFVAEEDFGIAPVEAQACGIPVIAFGRGASLETINGVFAGESVSVDTTGVFFKEQTTSSLNEAISYFEQISDKLDRQLIRNNSLRFSRQRFELEFSSYVKNKYTEFISK